MRLSKRSKAYVVGITGSFGTGKSYVTGIFGTLGAKVLDADRIAHDCIKRGTPAYRKIVAAFGPKVLGAGGEIDRAALASAAFRSIREARTLNRIVHPAVIRRVKARIACASARSVVVIDAPLLIEAGLHTIADALVVVKASRARQLERCVRKFGMKKSECLARIACQMPLMKKVAMADFVVDNGGAKSSTRRQAMSIWRKLAWK